MATRHVFWKWARLPPVLQWRSFPAPAAPTSTAKPRHVVIGSRIVRSQPIEAPDTTFNGTVFVWSCYGTAQTPQTTPDSGGTGSSAGGFPATFLATQTELTRRHITLFQVLLHGVGDVADYYFADADTDVSAWYPVRGGTIARATFETFAQKRGGGMTQRATLQVDQLQASLPNSQVLYGGTPVLLGFLALNGYLDDAEINIFKWDAANPFQTCAWHSSWIVQGASVTRTTVTLRLTTHMAKIQRDAPRTLYQVQCNNTLGDAACGLSLANFTDAVIATSGSDISHILFSSARATGFFDKGRITATSGLNRGVQRAVQTSTLAGGVMTCVLLESFPYVPNVGDSFNAIAGDDHLIGTCIAKFNNLKNFRGFPNIPPPETVL